LVLKGCLAGTMHQKWSKEHTQL